MNSSPCLQFLRPYVFLRLPAKKQAYRCFHHGARQSEEILRSLQKSLAPHVKSKPVERHGVAKEDGGTLDARSHAVAARIEELSLAKALVYPRIQNSTTATSMRVPEFRRKYRDLSREHPGQEEVTLHGRLQSIRRASSKLFFFNFTGEFENIQGLCNFRILESAGVDLAAFKDMSKLLKRGDHISITGKAVRTPTGELTIEASHLPRLLSPSLAPLPFKLEDDDSRIQNRHIDMLVNRQQVDILRLRSHIIKYMRDYFDQEGFLEFQTPILAENAGGAIARPFTTTSAESRGKELALRIAPELWLKRLVVGGVDRVFEIGPSFRNEGIDATHNPEFTMCEFYNAYASLEDLIGQTEELISGLAIHCQILISKSLTSLPRIDLARFQPPFKRLEFIPALESALGFTLPDLTSESAKRDLIFLLRINEIPFPEAQDLSLPKILDRLAGDYLEPASVEAPLFITHHPACMSPLSKSFVCPRTQQLVSARTELFVGGRELANMYEEENDPFEQRRKFVEQARRFRDDRAGEEVVVDEGYVQALESGLPPTGGWGCGIERLVMLFSGAKRISDCLSFGNLRNVVGLSAGAGKAKE